jgi:hypothetical protein
LYNLIFLHNIQGQSSPYTPHVSYLPGSRLPDGVGRCLGGQSSPYTPHVLYPRDVLGGSGMICDGALVGGGGEIPDGTPVRDEAELAAAFHPRQ